MPRVSVIVPSYNHSRFITKALESVRSQTFQDWEVIVIDDGSKDDSVAVASMVAACDPRITVQTNPTNLGTYGTQQRALDQARGDYIAVLNSDDFWHPEKLERQVAEMDAAPQAAACYVLGWKCDPEGNLSEDDVHADWPTTTLADYVPFLMYENRILASGVLFRRSGLRFETTCRYSGDWMALLEAAARGPFVCLTNRMVYWRQHDHNTYVISPKQLFEELRVRKSILSAADRWLTLPGDTDAIRRGLGKNAMNLLAIGVFFGLKGIARDAFRDAMTYHADKKSAIKRGLASQASMRFTRRYLWKELDAAFPFVPGQVDQQLAEMQLIQFQ